MSVVSSLASKHVTVMGLGRFGGGAGVTRWLVEHGATVLLTDLEPEANLAEPMASIADLVSSGRVTLRLGGHDDADFTRTDLVIANPAVPKPWDNRFLRAAADAGVPITTEIRLLVERLPARQRVIAITGTVGKSTTSAMIHHALAASGRTVWFGGNIGGSLLLDLARIAPDHDVVLEISSAMLHWLSPAAGHPAATGWSPGIAVATNIAHNHIDWHGSFDHYRASKQQILRDQSPADRAVLHHSLSDWPARAQTTSLVRAEDARDIPDLSIPGRHNRDNAAVAVAACAQAGLSRDIAARAVASFPGLPHRLEAVGAFLARGSSASSPPVRAFNDSKCTTPDAAVLALDAMDADPSLTAARTHLIAGGYDKKVDLSSLAAAAVRTASTYTIGATGRDLAAAIVSRGGRAAFCESLDRAVAAACDVAKPGDVILLSPGCASWDQFTNYEQRGADFARLVRATIAPYPNKK